MMLQLRFQETSPTAALQIAFPAKRIPFLQIRLVINQSPRPAIRRSKAFARLMLLHPPPQICCEADVKPVIRTRLKDINVEHIPSSFIDRVARSRVDHFLRGAALYAEGLGLRGGRHAFRGGQMRQKLHYFGFAHFTRMPLGVEQNVTSYPIPIGSLRPGRITAEPHDFPQLVAQAQFGIGEE